MVIAGLLILAAGCLALGLVTQSAVWLIASLIATAGAAFLLFKLRTVIATPTAPAPARSSGAHTTNGTGTGAGAAAPAMTTTRAETAGHRAVEPVAPGEVWVIDGRPRYHLGDCAIIKGQDAEAIPYDQATEDGFMPCSLCEPQAARTR
jgi:hypothetical protein